MSRHPRIHLIEMELRWTSAWCVADTPSPRLAACCAALCYRAPTVLTGPQNAYKRQAAVRGLADILKDDIAGYNDFAIIFSRLASAADAITALRLLRYPSCMTIHLALLDIVHRLVMRRTVL